jgi:spore maturation protein CgeB
VERFPGLDLGATDIPRALFLNKEYVNLEPKLAWVRGAGVSLAFSHHHGAARLGERAGVPAVFIPFAADHRRFFPSEGAKAWDLAFSGVLQNPNEGVQSDLRVRVMRRLFECEGDVPVAARPWCAKYKVFFNALPRAEEERGRAGVLGPYRPLDDDEYAALVRSSRVFLCTRSPADLVSPRYFECLASGTMVLAEASPAHAAVFPEGVLEEFRHEEEFEAKLVGALESGAWKEAAERGRREFLARHTWEHRVRGMLAALRRGLGAGGPTRAVGASA